MRSLKVLESGVYSPEHFRDSRKWTTLYVVDRSRIGRRDQEDDIFICQDDDGDALTQVQGCAKNLGTGCDDVLLLHLSTLGCTYRLPLLYMWESTNELRRPASSRCNPATNLTHACNALEPPRLAKTPAEAKDCSQKISRLRQTHY